MYEDETFPLRISTAWNICIMFLPLFCNHVSNGLSLRKLQLIQTELFPNAPHLAHGIRKQTE